MTLSLHYCANLLQFTGFVTTPGAFQECVFFFLPMFFLCFWYIFTVWLGRSQQGCSSLWKDPQQVVTIEPDPPLSSSTSSLLYANNMPRKAGHSAPVEAEQCDEAGQSKYKLRPRGMAEAGLIAAAGVQVYMYICMSSFTRILLSIPNKMPEFFPLTLRQNMS